MQLATSGLGPGAGGSKQMSPLRAVSQTAEILGVTQTQALLVFKDRYLGTFVSQAWVLKTGVPKGMWSSNILLLREKLGVLSSLLSMDCCVGGGVYGKIVSHSLLPF